MGKLYVLLSLSLFLFASCSQRLVTRGIKDKTSNYLVTTGGQQINASSIKINNNIVSADTASYSINSVSAIKIGKAYYGIKDGIVYDGVYYGKLMMLRRYEGRSYNMNTHSSRAVYGYYLQKQGQSDIINLNSSTLIESVRDNPLALRKAKASRIFVSLSFATAITSISGLACVFLPYSSPVRKPAVIAGLFSLPAFLITLPVAAHKRNKAIDVYNR